MEERLDDAINVLRNHAESQLVLGQLPPNLGPAQMTTLGYAAPPADPHLPDPVKVERATYNTSMILLLLWFTYCFFYSFTINLYKKYKCLCSSEAWIM